MTPKNLFNHFLNKISWNFVFRLHYSYLNYSNFGMVIVLHRVIDASLPINEPSLNNFIEITDKKLEETILNLQNLNVQFVSLAGLQVYLRKKKKPPSPLVHISFDDGYLDNFSLAYPILKKYNIPFSIFLVSDFINNEQPFLWWYIIEEIIKKDHPILFSRYNFSISETDYKTKSKSQIFEETRAFILKYVVNDKTYFEDKLRGYSKDILGFLIPKTLQWDNINNMLASGLCELGVHTRSHSQFKYLNLDDKIGEILDCKEAIKQHTGIVAKYFSYPYKIKENLQNFDVLKNVQLKSGMELAFTTFPDELNQTNKPFLIPRLFINDSVTIYTLKSRLNGSYQRSISKRV